MRTLLTLLTMLVMAVTMTAQGVVAEDRTVFTIYKNDNSWVDGYEMRRERIFGELFYIIKNRENERTVRIKADEVFRITEQEESEKEERVEYHYKRALEAKGNRFYQVAAREFEKVLSIDPTHIPSRNELAIIRTEIRPVNEAVQQVGTTQESKEETAEDTLRRIGLREDQIAFLKMVSQAHAVDSFRLIVQAVDNWVKDYKDYKISTKGNDLPPLRYPLIPES